MCLNQLFGKVYKDKNLRLKMISFNEYLKQKQESVASWMRSGRRASLITGNLANHIETPEDKIIDSGYSRFAGNWELHQTEKGDYAFIFDAINLGQELSPTFQIKLEAVKRIANNILVKTIGTSNFKNDFRIIGDKAELRYFV